MNIYQKLIEVRKLVDFLIKDEQGYQYKYVSGSSVLNTIRPKMDELGLLLTTDIVESTHQRFTWEGKDSKEKPKTFIQFVVNMKLILTWINAENPEEKLTSYWISSGEDEDPAKAEGKAHTYGERYYLLKFFKIPTDNEDPDAHQKPKVQPVQSAPLLPTMKERVIAEGKKKFDTPDAFKLWRVDNSLVEDLSKATEAQLTQLWAVLRERKDK